MSVLVDTSVWIRFLSAREPYASRLEGLLSEEDVVGHELVYGELLIGDSGRRTPFLEAYPRMRQARMISHSEVVQFVRTRNLSGRGVGWIDVHVLAATVVEGYRIWTADKPLQVLAQEFGIAYDPV